MFQKLTGATDHCNLGDPDNLADGYIQTGPDNLAENCFFALVRSRGKMFCFFVSVTNKVFSHCALSAHVSDMAGPADPDSLGDPHDLRMNISKQILTI